jgi:hypothetical protein
MLDTVGLDLHGSVAGDLPDEEAKKPIAKDSYSALDCLRSKR